MAQPKMKEAIVSKGPKASIVSSPIPTPGPNQLVIKVIVSGSNPKDWKIPNFLNASLNTGDDIAGTVHAVGPGVWEFAPGDRVACFHEMMAPGGSFAEYALGWQHATFRIAPGTSFEEAASVPLAAMTAAIGLHQRMGLATPWRRVGEEEPREPLVVYGGASAVGAYAIKLAALSNIHPIVVVAGRGISFVETLINRSKGDTIVDYRSGDEAVVRGIKKALDNKPFNYAFDAVSEHNSYTNIVAAGLSPTGHVAVVLPGKKYEGVPETVDLKLTNVGEAHAGDKDFAYLYFRYMAKGLAEGWFHGHPVEVVPGGLEGVEGALTRLMEGKASAVKYVFRIGETKAIGQKL